MPMGWTFVILLPKLIGIGLIASERSQQVPPSPFEPAGSCINGSCDFPENPGTHPRMSPMLWNLTSEAKNRDVGVMVCNLWYQPNWGSFPTRCLAWLHRKTTQNRPQYELAQSLPEHKGWRGSLSGLDAMGQQSWSAF